MLNIHTKTVKCENNFIIRLKASVSGQNFWLTFSMFIRTHSHPFWAQTQTHIRIFVLHIYMSMLSFITIWVPFILMTFNCQTGTGYSRCITGNMQFATAVCHLCIESTTCDHEMLSTTLFISLTSNLFQLEIRLSCIKCSLVRYMQRMWQKWSSEVCKESKSAEESVQCLIERSIATSHQSIFDTFCWDTDTDTAT